MVEGRTSLSQPDAERRVDQVIGKAKEDHVEAAATDRQTVRQRVEQIMAEEKIDEKAALKKVAKERGVSKSEAYREWQRGK